MEYKKFWNETDSKCKLSLECDTWIHKLTIHLLTGLDA